MTTSLKELFLLDPEVAFLNHGSFGATPRPVFDEYQAWQRRAEGQPVRFLVAELPGHLREARQALADCLHAEADDVAFIPNVTFGVNLVARSLPLAPGDEILASDHEYGACENAWELACRRTGARFVRQPISMPVGAPEAAVEQFWQAVTPRTKVIFLSHITSPTAQRLPVEAICRRAREAGILTLIDGAHAPGHIPLDLEAVGADFYAGNWHKWGLGPKGSAFLHTRRERQALVEPLVVSWGWGANATYKTGSAYVDGLEWTGTDDYSAYLAVPAAIRFQAEHDWPAVRARCHVLAAEAVRRICALTGLPPAYQSDEDFAQMAVAPLPPIADLPAFKGRLYDEFKVEIPCIEWNEQQFIRISVQGYNTEADIDRLLEGLTALLRR